MRPIDADALEKEGWSLHRTVRVDSHTSEYQVKQIAKIPTVSTIKMGKISTLQPIKKTWENRPKSNLVKQLIKKSGKTIDEIAQSLGYTKPYLNNKLHRDSFSLGDIVVVAQTCGYSLTFINNDPEEGKHDMFQIDPQDYLRGEKLNG